MELVTGQDFYYSNKEHLPIEDIAESLLAFKAILDVTPKVLGDIFPGVQIQAIQVSLHEVKTGSLLDDFIVKFIWGNQERLDEDIDRLRKLTHIEGVVKNKKLLGCIVIALILGGGIVLLKKMVGTEERQLVLQQNFNSIVINGALEAGVSPEQFSTAIQGALAENTSLPKEAAKAVSPAKREPDTSITANRSADVAINPPAVKAMPSKVLEEEDSQWIEELSNVELSIRAIDLDSTRRGWAAVVPSLGDHRIRLQLDPHIKTDGLRAHPHIRGDITVVYKYNKDGKQYPALVFLREVLSEDE